jgi:hypothetical protein
MELQDYAIKKGAVFTVGVNTMVNIAAWATEHQPCLHINFRPVRREDFDYAAFLPLSLVEKSGRVVAGVCVTSVEVES